MKKSFPFFVWFCILASGVQAQDWPAPIKALETQGVDVIGRFDAPGGLSGYAAMIQNEPLAIYLTPDGKQAIIGTMIDAQGNNLSQEPVDSLVNKPLANKVWKQLDESAWIADGDANAQRIVYTFTDPNCPYCHKFWNDARPWVKDSKVQLRHIIVGILRPSSPGKAAALLSAADPQAALLQHEQQHASGGVKPLARVPDKVRAQLDANQKLMHQLRSFATPTIFYKDANGKLQKVQGAPPAKMLVDIFGPG